MTAADAWAGGPRLVSWADEGCSEGSASTRRPMTRRQRKRAAAARRAVAAAVVPDAKARTAPVAEEVAGALEATQGTAGAGPDGGVSKFELAIESVAEFLVDRYFSKREVVPSSYDSRIAVTAVGVAMLGTRGSERGLLATVRAVVTPVRPCWEAADAVVAALFEEFELG